MQVIAYNIVAKQFEIILLKLIDIKYIRVYNDNVQVYKGGDIMNFYSFKVLCDNGFFKSHNINTIKDLIVYEGECNEISKGTN